MLPGRTPAQKKSLARKLREVLSQELDVDKMIVSVSVNDLPMEGLDKFLTELPDDSIIIPEEKNDDEKCKKGSCCCS